MKEPNCVISLYLGSLQLCVDFASSFQGMFIAIWPALSKLCNCLGMSSQRFQNRWTSSKDAASPKSEGHDLCSHLRISQIRSFPTVYDMPMFDNMDMSYTVGKLRILAFQWAGGHDRVFVSMVAASLTSRIFWTLTPDLRFSPGPKMLLTSFAWEN